MIPAMTIVFWRKKLHCNVAILYFVSSLSSATCLVSHHGEGHTECLAEERRRSIGGRWCPCTDWDRQSYHGLRDSGGRLFGEDPDPSWHQGYQPGTGMRLVNSHLGEIFFSLFNSMTPGNCKMGDMSWKTCVIFYASAFRRRRHYVFGLSVRLSVRPSVRPSVRRGFRAFAGECIEGLAWNFICWCILTIFRTD